MAVLIFEKAPTIYHYPPRDSQPDGETTRCGEKRKPTAAEGNIPTNWQPCDTCSEMDDRDQRLIGAF